MSWIYIIGVIVFAIYSNMNKTTKNKQKGTPRSGMPTFGGEGDGHQSRRVENKEQPGSGFPDPTSTSARRSFPQESEEYDASPAFPEPAYTPTPNYVSGEGMSLEQPDERDSIEARVERMSRDLERRQAAFDGIDVSDKIRPKKNLSTPLTVQSSFVDNRNDLRKGLIWAEILGPPRSRKSHSSSR